jgi:hypothetical protein
MTPTEFPDGSQDSNELSAQSDEKAAAHLRPCLNAMVTLSALNRTSDQEWAEEASSHTAGFLLSRLRQSRSTVPVSDPPTRCSSTPQEGAERSATSAASIDTTARSNGIVYVESGYCAFGHLNGRLLPFIATSEQTRYRVRAHCRLARSVTLARGSVDPWHRVPTRGTSAVEPSVSPESPRRVANGIPRPSPSLDSCVRCRSSWAVR